MENSNRIHIDYKPAVTIGKSNDKISKSTHNTIKFMDILFESALHNLSNWVEHIDVPASFDAITFILWQMAKGTQHINHKNYLTEMHNAIITCILNKLPKWVNNLTKPEYIKKISVVSQFITDNNVKCNVMKFM